jgi:hypothetical protein
MRGVQGTSSAGRRSSASARRSVVSACSISLSGDHKMLLGSSGCRYDELTHVQSIGLTGACSGASVLSDATPA